jgi:hypothetical protein
MQPTSSLPTHHAVSGGVDTMPHGVITISGRSFRLTPINDSVEPALNEAVALDMRQPTALGRIKNNAHFTMAHLPRGIRSAHAVAMGVFTAVAGHNIVNAYLAPIRNGMTRAGDITQLADKLPAVLDNAAALINLLDLNQIRGLIHSLSGLASNTTGNVGHLLTYLADNLSVLHDPALQSNLAQISREALDYSSETGEFLDAKRLCADQGNLVGNIACSATEDLIEEFLFRGTYYPVGPRILDNVMGNITKQLVDRVTPVMNEGIGNATAIIQESISSVQNQLLEFTGSVDLEAIRGNVVDLSSKLASLNQTVADLLGAASDTSETLNHSSRAANMMVATAIGVLGMAITLNIYSQGLEPSLRSVANTVFPDAQQPTQNAQRSMLLAASLGAFIGVAAGSYLLSRTFDQLTQEGAMHVDQHSALKVVSSMMMAAVTPYLFASVASLASASTKGASQQQPAAGQIELVEQDIENPSQAANQRAYDI